MLVCGESRRGSGSRVVTALLVASWCSACARSVVVEDDGNANGGGGASRESVHASASSGLANGASQASTGGGGGGPGLTEVNLGPRSGQGVITFAVGPRTLGITMVAKAPNDFLSVGFDTLAAPSGSFVVDGPLPGNHASWKRPGISSMAAPQIEHPESFPLAEGAWRFGMNSDAPTVDVSVWVRKTVDGNFHGGVIDLNVFASGGVTKNAHVLEVAANAFTDFGGIELGDVRFFDLGDGYLEIDDDNLQAALAATAEVPNRPALNVIATRKIGGKYEGSAGFATGIPGAPMSPGSREAAIVWMVQNDHVLDPILLRHEAGHFAGLFHTSEMFVGGADSLHDTPSCENVMSTYAQCPDFDYAMFPTGGSGHGLFSPHEEQVIRGSALYRGVFAAGQGPMDAYGPSVPGGPLVSPTEGYEASPDAVAHAKESVGSHTLAHPSGESSWADGLGEAAKAHLSGIGCVERGDPYFARFDELGLSSPDLLLALAENESAPSIVRFRAVVMLGRALGSTASPELIDRLARLSLDGSAPTVLRASALEAIAKNAPGKAAEIAPTLALEGDELLVHTLSRL